VLTSASGRAANPFESVLRAIALDVPGLDLRPQVGIAVAGGTRVVPDLVDVVLGIVAEADSHEFHTGRTQLTSDCWRYDELVLDGWDVYRFTYEQVMFQAAWVRSVLVRAERRARATQELRARAGACA
jgi:very-short-patch-repair endonuclease